MNRDKQNDAWVKAKRLCRLSDDEVRMARELGMGPRALIKNIPNRKQRWKAPVGIWIRNLYAKRIKKPPPKQFNASRPVVDRRGSPLQPNLEDRSDDAEEIPF